MSKILKTTRRKTTVSRSAIRKAVLSASVANNVPVYDSFRTAKESEATEILNIVLLKYSNLTAFQKEWLVAVFSEFRENRNIIELSKLKSLEHYYNNDDELLLYRKSAMGLTNIIINADECIAYSFISYDGNSNALKFYYNIADLKGLAISFFSN